MTNINRKFMEVSLAALMGTPMLVGGEEVLKAVELEPQHEGIQLMTIDTCVWPHPCLSTK